MQVGYVSYEFHFRIVKELFFFKGYWAKMENYMSNDAKVAGLGAC